MNLFVGLDPTRLATLGVALTALAALPSVSVFAVSARAASSGFAHGALTALGVVTGDIVFLLLALLGLALVVAEWGEFFVALKYLSAVYLIVLGVRLWRSRNDTRPRSEAAAPSKSSSFGAGFLLTLGDQKAVFFYLGFLPSFVELSRLTPLDVALLVVVTALTVGSVKLVYAYLASRTSALERVTRASRALQSTTAVGLILLGVFVALR